MKKQKEKVVSLTEREMMWIRTVLFNEAWKYKEMSEFWEEKGLKGCSVDAWADSGSLMKLREKFVEVKKK